MKNESTGSARVLPGGQQGYTIKDAAELLHVPPSTIRYYDKEGLLPFVARLESGYRLFSEDDMALLRVIECLKKTGMPIKEIRQFIDWLQEGDASLEKRSEMYVKGDQKGIDELEKQLLAQNAEHKDWTCSEEMMKLTKDGKALYLHCLPADISGLSCAEGEVDNSVFDRYLVPLYKQASYKPYIIAAMIFLAQVKDPVKTLMDLDASDNKRKMF